MLILCPACASVYEIDGRKLGAAGRTVRCKRCAHTWFERPEASGDAAPVLRGTLAPDETPADASVASTGRDALPDAGLATPAEERSPSIAPAGAEDQSEADAGPLQGDVLDERFDAASPSLDGVEAGGAGDAPTRAAGRRRGGEPRAGRDAAKPGRGRSLAARALAAASLAAACLLLGAFAWRDDVVRLVPDAAPAYASLGLRTDAGSLRVARVTSSLGQAEGAGELLVVEGDVVNGGTAAVEAPGVRIAVRDGAGVELYAWTAGGPGRRLEPGERSPFRARLASPPPSGASVGVTLAGPEAVAQGATR